MNAPYECAVVCRVVLWDHRCHKPNKHAQITTCVRRRWNDADHRSEFIALTLVDGRRASRRLASVHAAFSTAMQRTD